MAPHKRWTDEAISGLALSRLGGETVASLAARHGVSATRIHSLLRKHGRNQSRDERIAQGWKIVNGRWVAPDEA